MKLHNLSYKTLFTIFFLGIAGIILLTKFTKPKSAEAWWNASWNYRDSLYVNNFSSARTNVLVKILENYDFTTLISQGKVQADLDDLRFTTSGDTLLTYWVQDATTSSADVWAVIPSLPVGTTFIWMYYGNSSVGSGSTSLYSYSGSSQFIDLGNGSFKIKFLTNGTFTPAIGLTIDVFLVGGGGASGVHGGAGAGGYTQTYKGISISGSTGYLVTVGIGGSGDTLGTYTADSGDNSSAFGYSATGGGGSLHKNGGNGGSGGGAKYLGNGGSDGSNGQNGQDDSYGGTGQGTTTREFGETTGDLYSGGGGGQIYEGQISYGGAGGGGNSACDGVANTGGGAGSNSRNGGSGIVILRYNPYLLGYPAGNFNFEGLNMEGININ